MRTKIKELLELTELPTVTKMTVRGWVKTIRGSKGIYFIDLTDGSCIRPLQIVVSGLDAEVDGVCSATSLEIEGELIWSKGKEQLFDFQADRIKVLGSGKDFSIQPKSHTMEFMRERAHERVRTDLFRSVFKIRSVAAHAIHTYFQDLGYSYVHTPVITGSDCEGAGEVLELKDDEFFKGEKALTVSGQLHGETAMMGLGEIYTFGPTFRAEHSMTSRHLAEFWMVEPEIAFADLDELAELSEDFLKYIISYVMKRCPEEISFLRDWKIKEEKGMKRELQSPILDEKLQGIIDKDFIRITYTEAISILERSKPFKKGKFKFPVEWGVDLKAEHEKFLVEKHFKSPVIITDYPKDIKAFYMKLDGPTVKAMDVLFPGIGEIIGGSQREEDLDVLIGRMEEIGIPKESMEWYLDTRRFGTVPHAGFGLGFERLVMFLTGVDSIKDTTLFPRSYGKGDY